MSETNLSLLVLRTTKIGACLEFYQALGLTLVEEKHGKGPVHYSSSLNGITIEIYPEIQKNSTENSAERTIRLGFTVESLAATLKSLETLCATVLKNSSITEWGHLAVVLDPDGREVEINEPLTPSLRRERGSRNWRWGAGRFICCYSCIGARVI